MAINDVSLTAGMRSNLVSLQGTVDLLNRTQTRLASGKKVNSALDNPIAYFASRAHLSRANDINSLKEGMGEAVQTIKSADAGIKSLTNLIEAAKGLAQSALGASKNQAKIQFTAIADANTVTIGASAYTATTNITNAATQFLVGNDVSSTVSNLAALINAQADTTTDVKATASGTTLILEAKLNTVAVTQASTLYTAGTATGTILTDTDGKNIFSERRALADQYNEMINQMDAVANSSGYKGINLLADNDLSVAFEGTSLTVKGFSATASDLKLNTKATSTEVGWGWTLNSNIEADKGKLDIAISTLRSESSKLSNNLSIITIQQDFAATVSNTLIEGSDKLTLADMNEEGANMLMLQTRQALSTTALSLSSQAAQSVLRLFG